METHNTSLLQRSSSQASTASSRSRKSGTVRVKPRKYASSASNTPIASPHDKLLTSFPSLSLDDSPSKDATDDQCDSLSASHLEPPRGRGHSKKTSSIVESLTASSPAVRSRSALFDDSPVNSRDVPGALHHSSDDNIERLMARTGAVALVRQLAEDLAQRDAQMTALRRRAEERERVLKKMLRDCEVSNLDIETRLRELERPHDADSNGGEIVQTVKRRSTAKGTTGGVEGNIDELMNEAMADPVGLHGDEGVITPGFGESRDEDSTIRAKDGMVTAEDDRRSLGSNQSYGPKSGNTFKGWKDYLWSGAGTSRRNSGASSVAAQNGEGRQGGRSRANSGVGLRRKGLNNELFRPPENPRVMSENRQSSLPADLRSHEAADGSDSSAHSRKSSVSVTSWAVKLVAGNLQSARDNEWQKNMRGRASTTAEGVNQKSRATSTASAAPMTSAQAALSKVEGRLGNGQRPRKATASLHLGADAALKSPSAEGWRNLSSNVVPQGTAGEGTLSPNVNTPGPVEMDTILPMDSRPPTLAQGYGVGGASEYLTDRFGFIYDQRRKKRQNEASESLRQIKRSSGVETLGSAREAILVASDDEDNNADVDSVNSLQQTRPDTPVSAGEAGEGKQGKRWQDYLSLATFPTELLSHTPSPAAVPPLINADAGIPTKTSQITVDRRVTISSARANPEPSASAIVSEHAVIAKPSTQRSDMLLAPNKEQPEPVRLLLEQLTEVHDSLQRDKTVRWNEFLRKVRAERKKEGEAAASIEGGRSQKATMPEVSLSNGEMIGVSGLGVKGKVGRAKWQEFKRLVLGGIPVAYRAKIWAECSGASALRVPGYYKDLVNRGTDDPVILAQIQMDITRTLTDNVFFRAGPGVAKLNEVLVAYARRNPEVGYCQGMNLITGCLLLVMPTAEDAFWLLTSMIENILPQNYYDHSLLASRADQHVLRQYVAELLPRLSAHLDELSIELEALTFQWFLSVFTDCLSAEALFRVWDVVLCTNDGSTFLFQIALALLKLNETNLLKCASPAEVYTYINHQMTDHAISIDGLINAGEALKGLVRRPDVEERRARAVEEERDAVRGRGRERDKKRKEMMSAVTDGVSAVSVGHEGAAIVEQGEGADGVPEGGISGVDERENKDEDESNRQDQAQDQAQVEGGGEAELKVYSPMPTTPVDE
ncbi:MAG: hypothetical protein M1819_001473 [Sarea resinae]|nr:MAG: hypothetical protein M1819_001473 [Sarea resinae]